MLMKTATLLTLLALVLLVGCRQQAQPTAEASLQIDLRTEPEALAVGESTLIVTVRDASGQPISDANVNVRGDMNHAGMAPVIETAKGGTDGEYHLPFEWDMAGDWIVEVTVELASGLTETRTFDLLVEV
jgi:hypothetical protein